MRRRLFSLLAAALLPVVALAQTPSVEERSRALTRAADAVVGIRVHAVDGARSATTLGSDRVGSGVVIGEGGLVLTIGYLILEADAVEVLLDDGGRVPGRVVGYDTATGFGLVQTLVPLKVVPAPLGDAASVGDSDVLVVVSGGRGGAVGPARLVSRRAFSGYWEYHIDGALFTAPARGDHSGAALIDLDGRVVGIGSLVVADATDGSGAERVQGNMFVPIDLLKPILAELREQGASRASTRPWIGINAVEQNGQIRISRVNDDSPADAAGLRAGDRITGIDGVAVTRLEQLWKRLWSGSGAERDVVLDVERDGRADRISVHAVDRATTLRRASGI